MMNTFQFSLALVRAIGLYMVATACAALVGRALMVADSSPIASGVTWFYWGMIAQEFLSGGIGLLLLLKGTVFARLLARGTYAEGHCQRCGYNLSGSDATRCPECGDSGPTGDKGPGETP